MSFLVQINTKGHMLRKQTLILFASLGITRCEPSLSLGFAGIHPCVSCIPREPRRKTKSNVCFGAYLS